MTPREAGRAWAEREWKRATLATKRAPWNPGSMALVRRVAASLDVCAHEAGELNRAASEHWRALQAGRAGEGER